METENRKKTIVDDPTESDEISRLFDDKGSKELITIDEKGDIAEIYDQTAMVTTDEQETKVQKEGYQSIPRYLVNIFVRSLFFFGLLPILLLLEYVIIPGRIDIWNLNPVLLIPYGLSIFIALGTIGAILDILLPKRYVIGGIIAVKGFNIGTFTWFEGIRFNISVGVDASGKGVSVKDKRE